MKNIDGWKDLFSETLGDFEVAHKDTMSIFILYDNKIIVIENEGPRGLQIQYRRSYDPEDTIVCEDIIVDGKITSVLTSHNYEDIKKIVSEFVSKL